ncbi:MAG: hypothetical protein ACRD2G_13515, partial [Terriglobia bacterium]
SSSPHRSRRARTLRLPSRLAASLALVAMPSQYQTFGYMARSSGASAWNWLGLASPLQRYLEQ